MKLLVALCFVVLFAPQALGLTTSQVYYIEGVLKSFFDHQNPIDNATGTPGVTRAGIIRTAFHDCGTWDPTTQTGGCHACMAIECPLPNTCEYTSDVNRGLPPFVNLLENLYVQYNLRYVLSRADFWHLAAKYAVEYSSGFNVTIPFNWGRTDCSACPLPYFPNELPDAARGFPEIQRVFGRMGFSLFESTALIGAHVMGHCEPINTGYQGAWDAHPDQFNNLYFQGLVLRQWARHFIPSVIPGEAGKNQFSIPNNAFPPGLFNVTLMLPTDMALLYDGIVDTNCNATLNASTSCPFNDLTAGYVRQFAVDNKYWLQAFAAAFYKLQSFGNSNLQPVTDTDGNPGPFFPESFEPCFPTGPVGAAGPAGPAGPVGPAGGSFAGPVGPVGPVGPRGFPGAIGAVGPAGANTVGPRGSVGPVGAIGYPGPVGPIGPIGQPGYAGSAGVPGPVGAVGMKGQTGAAGAAGLGGYPGAKGPTGPTGPNGLAGDPGLAGATGAFGPKGGPGYPGAVGNTGVTGYPGVNGYPGATGATGATGYQGLPGVGYPGATGATGSPGPIGYPGAVGAPGTPGTPGAPFTCVFGTQTFPSQAATQTASCASVGLTGAALGGGAVCSNGGVLTSFYPTVSSGYGTQADSLTATCSVPVPNSYVTPTSYTSVSSISVVCCGTAAASY